jgi:dipeptidyl aminopeptidase/acylaminoacyl peptidase
LAAVRLGRRQGANGAQRGPAGIVAGAAVAALAASVVLAGAPSGAADRAAARDPQWSARRAPGAGPGRDQGQGQGGTADQLPVHFVAENGGRIAVVSADTGRVERYLTSAEPGGGAEDPSVSPDGRTVWFSRGDGTCAAHIASVPVGGGKEQKLPGSGEAGPEGRPLPRPGKAQLAWSRADCKGSDTALVVGDLRGREGHGQKGLVPLAWSRDGDHLLAVTPDGAEVHLLDVNQAGLLEGDQVLAFADGTADCRLQVVDFSPDDNDGYVAERRCGPSGEQARRSLVLLDRNGGFRRAVLRLPRGEDFVDRAAFDPSGHALLYSTAPSQYGDRAGTAAGSGDQLSLWVWRDGESRLLARGSRYRHPAWLP